MIIIEAKSKTSFCSNEFLSMHHVQNYIRENEIFKGV